MKPFWTSKTLWVNVFAIIVIVGQAFYGQIEWVTYEAPFLAVVNMILRLTTNTGLSTGDNPDENHDVGP